jgi:hypothetical protein
MPDATTIQVDSQVLLNAINSLLPVVENYVPAAKGNAQNIQLGVSAAQSLVSLISLIPAGGTITPEAQAAQFARVYKILAGDLLSGPEWVKQV